MRLSKFGEISWRKALLTPASDGCFSESFYPARKRGTKSRQVWYSVIQITELNTKLIIVSALNHNNIRLVTAELGSKILTDFGKATALDSSSLNLLCEAVSI